MMVSSCYCISMYIKASTKHRFAHQFLFTEKSEFNNYDVSNIYSSKGDWGAQFRAPTTLQNFGYNPNGLTKKQEMMVRSAIKYWVERHKHVVRLVWLYILIFLFTNLVYIRTTSHLLNHSLLSLNEESKNFLYFIIKFQLKWTSLNEIYFGFVLEEQRGQSLINFLMNNNQTMKWTAKTVPQIGPTISVYRKPDSFNRTQKIVLNWSSIGFSK